MGNNARKILRCIKKLEKNVEKNSRDPDLKKIQKIFVAKKKFRSSTRKTLGVQKNFRKKIKEKVWSSQKIPKKFWSWKKNQKNLAIRKKNVEKILKL